MTDKGEPTPQEQYDIYRKYILHEDELIHNRITWMLSIHGFLYATYGFTLQKLLETNEKISSFLAANMNEESAAMAAAKAGCYLNRYSLGASLFQVFAFLICLCLIGLFISGVSWASISGAFKAATAVARTFDDQFSPRPFFLNIKGKSVELLQYTIFDESKFRLPLLTGGGYKSGDGRGFAVASNIPKILIVGWLLSLAVALIDAYSTYHLFIERDQCKFLTTKTPQQQNPVQQKAPEDGSQIQPSDAAPKH